MKESEQPPPAAVADGIGKEDRWVTQGRGTNVVMSWLSRENEVPGCPRTETVWPRARTNAFAVAVSGRGPTQTALLDSNRRAKSQGRSNEAHPYPTGAGDRPYRLTEDLRPPRQQSLCCHLRPLEAAPWGCTLARMGHQDTWHLWQHESKREGASVSRNSCSKSVDSRALREGLKRTGKREGKTGGR